jgi:phospholipid/cholesterol/gamma-HCH transport system permease protein
MHGTSIPPGFPVPPPEIEPSPWHVFERMLGALRRLEARAVLTQMHEIGYRSLGFACVVLGFVGAIFVYQAGLQTLRVVPDMSGLGASYIELLVRDLAASITALMLATRVGAGIAAEIGSMKVTDQLDALRLCRAEPIEYLVAPRFVASLAVTWLVVVLAGCTALVSGTLTAHLAFGVSPHVFVDLRYVGAPALAIGLTKAIAYGAAIPLMSAHAGLSARGGSQGVGDATTNAVVRSSLAVIMLNFVISGLGHVVFSL